MKLLSNIFIFIVLLAGQITILLGQNSYDGNVVSDSIIASKHNTGAYEISDIIFVGNTYFSGDELLDYISSKPTTISIPNKILSTYYSESRKNKYFPNIFVEQLHNSLEQFNNEYKYFNRELAESDVKILTDLYNINGFHSVNITYSYKPNQNNNKNVLIFYIKENEKYSMVSSVIYKGLEGLSIDVKKRFDTLVKIKKGDIFNEEKIDNEIRAVHSLLLRTGYMYSKFDYRDINVIKDAINYTDSVVAIFDLGNRIKIGNIIFVDSTHDQKIVANSTKRTFIRFNEGEYYNQNRLERSIDNLLSTGVFESVVIDTVIKEYTDDIRDFIITSKYRKLKDWNGGLTFNKTQIDRFVNAGIWGEIFHRNAFGSAQAIKLYGSITLKDIEHTISGIPNTISNTDIEFKVGMSYSQPMLWQIENTRVALSSNLEYSWELLNGLFNISKISFPVSFPTRLPWNQYFSNLNVEFNISREVPVNYSSVADGALNNAKTLQDTNNILSALALYSKIDDYINQPETHWFTSNLISVSITGDDRDNPFVTTTGSMTNISFDGFNPIFFHSSVSGGAKYLRFQAIHTHFWKLSKTSVLGIKGKLGHTFVFDEENSFVPQDRQFFAGGANSVRAWKARELRYSNYMDKLPDEIITNFFKNYIGSKTLIDGSIEFRRKLNDIPGLSENLASFMDGLGIGLFIDFGNTFDWYAEYYIDQTKIKLTDYITKLAVGTGFGVRYETPIGPIRFDFATPLYDPAGRRPAFWNLIVIFGIGHAF